MAALELIRPACLVRLTDQKSLFLLGVDLYSPSAESLVRYLWYIYISLVHCMTFWPHCVVN